MAGQKVQKMSLHKWAYWNRTFFFPFAQPHFQLKSVYYSRSYIQTAAFLLVMYLNLWAMKASPHERLAHWGAEHHETQNIFKSISFYFCVPKNL